MTVCVAARCVWSKIPGALSILKGAVPGLARGLEHTAPTYAVGSRDRSLRRPWRLRIIRRTIGGNAFRSPSTHPRRRIGHASKSRLMSSIRHAKADLREKALARRAAIPAGDRDRLSRIAAGRISPLIGDTMTVALFWPIRDEIDPRSLSDTVRAAGGQVVLPAVTGDGIVFRRFNDADPLESGPLGTRHPPASAPELHPDLIVAPLAAFDRAGGRIGYGAGYYDNYVSRLRAAGHPFRFVGIAFACQEVDRIPLAPHDEKLDAIATEDEWIVVAQDNAERRPAKALP